MEARPRVVGEENTKGVGPSNKPLVYVLGSRSRMGKVLIKSGIGDANPLSNFLDR